MNNYQSQRPTQHAQQRHLRDEARSRDIGGDLNVVEICGYVASMQQKLQ
ncbi:MAG: hypothetical protein MSA26_01520 [Lachnospiraceae bacterium]|nr:hypothetical protein [Lachnospiraceae bacterium]